VKRVIAVFARDEVISIAANGHIIARICVNLVIAKSAEDFVIRVSGNDRIVTREAIKALADADVKMVDLVIAPGAMHLSRGRSSTGIPIMAPIWNGQFVRSR
jgi:hypothetical protein